MNRIFTKRFRVHTYEVDFRAKALPLSLLNYFQDAAGDHAGDLGFSLFELLKKQLTWLLSRYHLKVFRYPALDEVLSRVDTAEGQPGPVFRHGIFHKAKDHELARLRTVWAPFSQV